MEKKKVLLRVPGFYWLLHNASFLPFHYIFRLRRARCCGMWDPERESRQNILEEEEELELPFKRLIAYGWEAREGILGK